MKVFRLTSEISKQVFPLTIDLDHPGFMKNVRKLNEINVEMGALEGQTGIGAKAKRGWLTAKAGAAFLQEEKKSAGRAAAAIVTAKARRFAERWLWERIIGRGASAKGARLVEPRVFPAVAPFEKTLSF